RVPADAHGQGPSWITAGVRGRDGQREGFAPQDVLAADIGLREPPASEVAGVEGCRRAVFLVLRSLLDIVHPRGEQQTVDGVELSTRFPVAAVRRKVDRASEDLSLDRPAVWRERAADAVGVGEQDRAAEEERRVAGE